MIEERRLQLFAVALIPLAACGFCLIWAVPSAWAARLDPAKVVGPEACAECHDAEFRVWRETAHARLYESDEPLHRRDRAREIARNLGVRLIKHDSLCLSCHFTPTRRGDRVTAVAGVSCESCHGAARDWITVHNTFRGERVRRAEESPAERRARVERNVSLGMYTPERIHDLASRCYGCHLVPEEELVAVGGHTSGGSFDLAERIDVIRHNFVTTGRAGNAPLPAELRRKLAVLGPALELEHGLRALAAAEDAGGSYAQGLARRAEQAAKRLSRLARAAPLSEIEAIRSPAEGIRLEAGNAAELGHAAEGVAEALQAFSRAHDGSRLAALESMGAGGAPDEPEDRQALVEALLEGADSPEGPEGPGETGGGESGSGASPAAEARPSIPEVEGERRTRIREPLGQAAVVGPFECGSCHRHARQSSWWRGDAHARSAGPLLRRLPKAVEIATLYYGKPAGDLMVKGAAMCMDCHGTVPTGEAAWEVESGVSCEHCHGPAGEYVRSHQEASAAERRRLGMVELGDPATRARVCSSCHHVTDRRLLASGHPPGSEGFELAARSAEIVHWEDRPQPPAGALTAAYRQALRERGPVPSVRVARLDPAVLRTAGGPSGSGSGVVRAGPDGIAGGERGFGAPSFPAARPARASGAPGPSPAAGAVELPPLPEGSADLELDELLLLVKERLDALFEATSGEGGE